MRRGLLWLAAGLALTALILVALVPSGFSAEVFLGPALAALAGLVVFAVAAAKRRRSEQLRQRSLDLAVLHGRSDTDPAGATAAADTPATALDGPKDDTP